MINVIISDNLEEAGWHPSFDSSLLVNAARKAVSTGGAQGGFGLTIVLTDDDQLRDLNRQFLGVDAPTDVLAFPGGDVDPDSSVEYLGDVIVSYPRALSQSETGGHSIEDELQLLVVHGVLHLLGHDHAEIGEKAAMWDIQGEILESLGCSLKSPSV